MSDVQIKKIRPFPFDAVLTHGGQAFPGRVVKMTMTGFMFESPFFLKAGEKYDSQFQLPVLKSNIQSTVVCMRTWDQFAVTARGNATHKLAELHFHDFKDDSREHLVQFLRKIGQLK